MHLFGLDCRTKFQQQMRYCLALGPCPRKLPASHGVLSDKTDRLSEHDFEGSKVRSQAFAISVGSPGSLAQTAAVLYTGRVG